MLYFIVISLFETSLKTTFLKQVYDTLHKDIQSQARSQIHSKIMLHALYFHSLQ